MTIKRKLDTPHAIYNIQRKKYSNPIRQFEQQFMNWIVHKNNQIYMQPKFENQKISNELVAFNVSCFYSENNILDTMPHLKLIRCDNGSLKCSHFSRLQCKGNIKFFKWYGSIESHLISQCTKLQVLIADQITNGTHLFLSDSVMYLNLRKINNFQCIFLSKSFTQLVLHEVHTKIFLDFTLCKSHQVNITLLNCSVQPQFVNANICDTISARNIFKFTVTPCKK